MIYIIKKIWIDKMENSVDSAVGYSIIGYARRKSVAEFFCEGCRMYTQKDCWAISKPLPELKFKKIKHISTL